METLSISASILIVLFSLPFFSDALFEYVCDEKLLYKPYVHVYKSRRGERLHDYAPGLHDVAEYKNVYICINGIAYLYFSKNTELGEVYEAPQMKKYSHYCEMYNVQPREGSASILELQLHLRGILLLGDPNDYRLPAIQEFTAPYYFKKDRLNPRLSSDPGYEVMPAHYINASSIVIIGQSECTLSKGKSVLIKVRPHKFPPSEGEVEESYICKIGYLSLLEKATTPPGGPVPSMDDRAPALAMLNDEAIRVEGCVSSPKFSAEEATPVFEALDKEVESIEKEYKEKKADHEKKYNDMVEATLNPLNEEKKKLEGKLASATKEKEKKRVEKQLEQMTERITVEEEKKKVFEKALEDLITHLTALSTLRTEAKPDGSKSSTAKTDGESAEKAQEEWKKLAEKKPPAPQTEIDEKKKEYVKVKRKARDSANDYQMAVSDLEIGVRKLRKLVENVKVLSVYSISSHKGRDKGKRAAGKVNREGSMSVVITANETECEKLSVLEGDEGECIKGKPDKDKTCGIFKALLGLENPWKGDQENQPPPKKSRKRKRNTTNTGDGPKDASKSDDKWKGEVLELIGGIFSTACDKILNVKKLTKQINRVMGYYLTSPTLFNLKPNLTTDTCVNFKFTKNLKILGSAGVMPDIHLDYKEEKQFWNTIKMALRECKNETRKLSFREAKGSGQYSFIKDFGMDHEKDQDVVLHEEQADSEYRYNWVIDMNWKMFVTVLGLCMPGYEQKIPLITSRFFSMYTESFLIPLRETWMNPKDNILFQFLLGEFYNGDTEDWVTMCMESSFIYSDQRDYRPPRSLLVNCASEHNYFHTGHFAKEGK